MKKFITITEPQRKTMTSRSTTLQKKTTDETEKHTKEQKQQTPSAQVIQQTNNNIINVFTDGSCIQSSKNKLNRPAGYACVFSDYPSFNFSAKLEGKEKTNNRAEYTACIMAFKIADKIDPKHASILYVHTDSELLINSLTKWLSGWKSKNWKKADGSPVKNIDLLKILDDQMKSRIVVFKHVRAHTGKTDWASIHNDLADRLAKKAALS
jgi:ribonuclease HI